MDKSHMKECVQKVQRGGDGAEDAWGELYSAMWSKLLNRLRGTCSGTSLDAEDVFQNGTLKARSNILSLKNPERFEGWYWTILKNQFIDQIRQQKSALDEKGKEPKCRPTPEAALQCEEILQSVGRTKASVFLRRFEGYKLREIGEEFGLTAGRVSQICTEVAEEARRLLDGPDGE